MAAGRGRGLGDASRVPLCAALGATFLAGFDLIPLSLDALANLVRSGPLEGGLAGLRTVVPSTHIDYWIHHNERQFNAPYVTAIWAPQHIAAVLIALLAIHLILRRAQLAEITPRSSPFGAAWLLPAALLAALPALSAYVAAGLALGVVGASIAESLRERRMIWHTASWGFWLVPGIAALVLAAPVLAVLASGPGPGLVVRVSAAGRWVNGALWSSLFGSGVLTGLADSIAVFLVELGAVGLLAALEIRRRNQRGRQQAHQRHVVSMLVAIIVLVTFVRPPVGGPNNLYARPLVLVWFLLAPFAAMRFVRTTGLVTRAGGIGDDDHAALSRARRPLRKGSLRWTVAALLLCLAASAFAIVGAFLEGALFWGTAPGTVEAARWINRNAPEAAVIAVHPDDFDSAFGYWLRRPLALADRRHALLFGATESEYDAVGAALEQAFAAAAGEAAASRFDELEVDWVIVGDDRAAPWAGPPCFEAVYSASGWSVVRRLASACR